MRRALFIVGLLLLTPHLQAQSRGLKALYNTNNTAYFGGKLPKMVKIDRLGKDTSAYANTYVDSSGAFHISFCPYYRLGTRYEELTLVHEMCHIEQWDEAVELEKHGPKWRACMYRLKSMGAFDDMLIETN